MNKHAKKIITLIEGEKTFGVQFYEKTKINRIPVQVSSAKWPKSWKSIHFKTYPRFRAFTATHIVKKQTPLEKLLITRRSTREFSGEEIPFNDFFSLMKHASGILIQGNSYDDSRRSYASAGARYPLEVYALVSQVTDLKPGLYHYSVKENLIELMYEKNLINEIKDIFGEDILATNASVIFFITGIPERTTNKYGNRGHRYMYIEAGLLAQNLTLLATEASYASCIIGGFIEDKVISLLDIQLQNELPLLAIIVGKKIRKK